jgi:hypothetical protein
MPNPTDKACIYREAIRVALLHEWDPIGIAECSGAQDEYDSYVEPIYELLVTRQPESEILRYLRWVETDRIGLGHCESTKLFAKRLIHLEKELEKEFVL